MQKVDAAIKAEIERAKAAERDNNNSITAEAATRKSEDKAIKNLLQNEVTRATDAESTLQNSFD